jgi:hypothetical protein
MIDVDAILPEPAPKTDAEADMRHFMAILEKEIGKDPDRPEAMVLFGASRRMLMRLYDAMGVGADALAQARAPVGTADPDEADWP